MKIAFYKARHGGLIDWLIDVCTERRGYSHCEFVFSDGMFFSSSGRDGGCRFKQIDPDPDHWEILDFPLSDRSERELRKRCQELVDRHVKYDWTGVLGFVLPLRACPRRLFCSECLVDRLQSIGLLIHTSKSRTSPADLLNIINAVLDLRKLVIATVEGAHA